MKKLVKMKLINWHLFTNETIVISNNCLITGENGTGKSTLLDAMQYVLTAGKAKFNSAANDSGKRNLVGYVRGKVGYENAPYLRMGEVISYVALEYYDEKTKESQIIGCLIELSASDLKKELFFQILKTTIQDDLFMAGNKLYNQQEFKRHLKKKQAYFENKKSSASALFRQSLGVSAKYFDLIPRALAFKPINQVDQFIYDFLLMEDPVKIDDLKESIHAYRHLSDVLKQQEDRLKLLEKVSTKYELYKKNNHMLEDYRVCLEVLNLEKVKYEIESNTKSYERKQTELNHLNNQSAYLNETIVKLQKDVFSLENSLENYEAYKLKKSLEGQYELEHDRFKQIEKEFLIYERLLKEELKIFKKLRIKESAINQIESKQYDTAYLNEVLMDWKDEVRKRRDDLSFQKANLNLEKERLQNEIDVLNKQYEALLKNMFYYSKEVNGLLDLLRSELQKQYGRRIEVKPLCEYLEVEDETWRNALEGFLNTQRFDVIIDPMYFKDALYLYERYKKENHLYGVGLVNVAYLGKYEDALEGSLACKVKSVNTYARRYANMILNKMHCATSIEELTNYPSAITSSCMTYRNFAVRAINPKIYEKPYLGQEALKIQKKTLEVKLATLKEQFKQTSSKITTMESTLRLLDTSHVDVLSTSAGVVDGYKQTKISLDDLKERLDAIKKDESMIGLLNQLETLQVNLNQKRLEHNDLLSKSASLDYELKQIQDSLTQLKNQLEKVTLDPSMINQDVLKLKDSYLKKYKHDFHYILNLVNSRIKDYEGQLFKNEGDVLFSMKEFNHQTKLGYAENLNSISEYLSLYYSLRDIEISKRQEDVRRARMKCEMSFQESFISRLNEKIMNAKKDIQTLNKGLKNQSFNGDTYAFEVSPSKAQKKYYDIIVSNKQYMSDDLFVETLDEKNRGIMDDLFNQIALLDDSEKSEALLQKYTDYRKYLDYDIIISHENGQTTRFSKVNKEKSGGETQNPFYIVIASSFEQLIKNRANEDSGCVVLFDEAFNNMDETRIQAMMNFYRELNVQIIMVVPPERASAIMPYVDTTLITIKDGDCSFVEEIIHESV